MATGFTTASANSICPTTPVDLLRNDIVMNASSYSDQQLSQDANPSYHESLHLNLRAAREFATLKARALEARVVVHEVEGGGTVLDAGIAALGGLAAGRDLARICLAGLGEVALVPAGSVGVGSWPGVQVWTDHPVAACLASQYAGWALNGSAPKCFAMGSGPMRAVAGREPLFDQIGHRERADAETGVVGVLETRALPSPEIVGIIAQSCGVEPQAVKLAVAPTASLAGTFQVVARSVETALHKLETLGFDLSRLVAGFGVAPLPPIARDDLAAIGRTNDAILYGATVELHVVGDDDSLAQLGPQVPSCASPAHGATFAEVFRQAGFDFYKIDPALFSPAVVRFRNLTTGRSHSFGRWEPDLLQRSFEASSS